MKGTWGAFWPKDTLHFYPRNYYKGYGYMYCDYALCGHELHQATLGDDEYCPTCKRKLEADER